MNIDSFKRKIIIIIVILLIFICCIGVAILNLNKKNSYETEFPNGTGQIEMEVNKKIETCKVANEYFIVKEAIENFYLYSWQLNNSENDELDSNETLVYEQQEILSEDNPNTEDYLYDMLSEDYIKEFNIKKDDIKNKFSVDVQGKVVINNMLKLENSENVLTYFVSGIYVDTTNAKKEDFFIAVSLDMFNNTYCVYPEEYCQKHGYKELKLNDGLNMPIDKVENKTYNEFRYKTEISDSSFVNEYFDRYKYNMLYDFENAYNMLNKNYRKLRFTSLEDYKKYVDGNSDDLANCTLNKYQITNEDGEENDYVCIDNFGRYYIFHKVDIMNYDVQLDTYTIKSDEFKNKYMKSDDLKKCGMQIEKINEAINLRDYKFVYNHMADSFKSNYYKNQSDLENILNEKLFRYNDVEYLESNKEGDLCIYNIKVVNSQDISQTKNMTIIMQLKDDMDFVMSFSME
mgnify:CR=1 FL=1